MSLSIGLVTIEEFADLTPDDRLLIEPLAARGIAARPVLWDAGRGWEEFDALVIRSPWDYFERPDEFSAWIDERETAGTRMFNPAGVLRWNMHKGYLRELAAAGIPIVETEWVERGSPADLTSLLERRGWRHAVMKPAISGGAWNTSTVRLGDPAASPVFEELVANHDVMVQPFLTQIHDEGEWSVIFFGDEHAATVLKRPAQGDYRVQERHGGTTISVADPPRGLVAQAAAVLPHAPGDLLYARVDGVMDGERFVLIELEVLEPYLFFSATPGSVDRFADALARALQKSGAC